MATPIQAVVFDLDGLMLNTEDVFAMSGEQLLERRGLTMTDEIHHAMLGRRPDEAFQNLKDITGITDGIECLKTETKELFQAIAVDHLATMPGLEDLFGRIDALSLPKAVATSSPRDYLNDMLARFELQSHFEFTLTAEDVEHGKPHPEIYLTAAQRFDIPTHSMLVLEDSQAGVTAGASAKAVTIAVPNQHTQNGDFSMATLRVDSLHDQRLLALLR
ncbi:MAG: HAD family phosphatase [Planctomycetaceae bacterium]|nr:HAD family phosphatase [Planctomycetaceae bacterium]